MRDPLRTQRGQAVPLVAVVLVVVAMCGVGVVHVAGAASRRSAAQAAADAAALAGAAEGEDAARAVAEANRAELIAYRDVDLDVVVTVRRAGVTATARGRWTATAADWRAVRDGG